MGPVRSFHRCIEELAADAGAEDVGRLCAWGELFPSAKLRRSRYERVLIHAIAGRRLRIDERWYRAVGMRGWSEVVFRSADDGRRHHFSIDYLLGHLDEWDEALRPAPVRRRRRRPSS